MRLKNSRKAKLFSFQDLSHSEFLSQHGQMVMAAFFGDISSHLPVAIRPQEIILSGISGGRDFYLRASGMKADAVYLLVGGWATPLKNISQLG